MLQLINPWDWLDGEPLEEAVSRCVGDDTLLKALLRKVIDHVNDVHAIVVFNHDGIVIDLCARKAFPLEKLSLMAAAQAALPAEVTQACGYGGCSNAWVKCDEGYFVVLHAPQVLIAMIYPRDFKI